MSVQDVLKLIEEKGVQVVDLRFMDLPGQWQHFSVPASALTERSFEEGFGIDASSVRGWRAIDESDMLVRPDAETPVMDPFAEAPTLILNCTVADPITKENYDRDPRYIAIKAAHYLQTSGVGDAAYFGPEMEFFVFDDVRYETTTNSGFYAVDSAEGSWNTGRDEQPNLGHKIRTKGGYFPVPPIDSL
jgi:glutamine synthetase